MLDGPNTSGQHNPVSRREFVRWSGAAAAAVAVPAWMPRVAMARGSAGRDVIVSIFLRGGADGLTLCVPHGDAGYYANRPTLGVPPPGSVNGCTDLDGFFGLPPAMAALIPVYRAGHLAIVHATGSMGQSHSHFEAQRIMESGGEAGRTLSTGWLGRHIASVSPMDSTATLRAIGIGYQMPLTLQGAEGAGTIATAGAGPYVPPVGTFANPATTGAGASSFSKALQQTAALIRANAGVEAVAIDKSGWDTHASQGNIAGPIAAAMADLANSLRAFYEDVIVNGKRNVTVVVMSEFGRRVPQNDLMGTDHGRGGCMFLIGRKINGGRVITRWPGLGAGRLHQDQDLDVTIDYRDILAEIVQTRLGNTDLAMVFPGYSPTFRNVAMAG